MRKNSSSEHESNVQSLLRQIRSYLGRGPPLLVVLCGPSHAGKSTFARGLGENFTTISSDEIRRELNVSFRRLEKGTGVWKLFESRKRKALKEGRNVILDACHLSRGSRWYTLQGTNGQCKKICVVFDLPLRMIKDRCIEGKRLSLQEVERMWRAFRKPTQEELNGLGFDEIYIVGEENSGFRH